MDGKRICHSAEELAEPYQLRWRLCWAVGGRVSAMTKRIVLCSSVRMFGLEGEEQTALGVRQ